MHHDGDGPLDPDYAPDEHDLSLEAHFYYALVQYETDCRSLMKTPWGPVVEGRTHAWREWMRFKRKERITFATDTEYAGYYNLRKSVPEFYQRSVDYFGDIYEFRHLFMKEATMTVTDLTQKGGSAVAMRYAALWFATLCFNSLHFWRNVPPVWSLHDTSAQSMCCFALRTFCADTLRAVVAVQRAFKRRKAVRTIQRWWREAFYNPLNGVFVSKVGKVRFKVLARSVSA